jgi:hypothetical protein
MKSFLPSLIHFMPFLLQNSTQFSTTTNTKDLLYSFIIPRHGPRRKYSLSIVDNTTLLIRYLAIVACMRFRVCTKSLFSNDSIRRNTLQVQEQVGEIYELGP